MLEVYYWLTSIFSSLLCPLIALIVDIGTVSYAGAFDGISTVMIWLGLFNNNTVVPAYFSLSFEILLISYFAGYFMRLLRWVVDIIPFI